MFYSVITIAKIETIATSITLIHRTPITTFHKGGKISSNIRKIMLSITILNTFNINQANSDRLVHSLKEIGLIHTRKAKLKIKNTDEYVQSKPSTKHYIKITSFISKSVNYPSIPPIKATLILHVILKFFYNSLFCLHSLYSRKIS
mmetsp:Transcript_21092/g.3419  ORF Transcript_21092/g.3419 Transcript_21092/m.3419 type:complete len:146 (-) Transcript_21092:109-546(-)